MTEESATLGSMRQLRGLLSLIGSGIAIALSIFQLYTAGFGALTAMFQRGIHIMLILAVVFLYYPSSKKASKVKFDKYLFLDLFLFSLAFIVMMYLLVFFDEIILRQGDWNVLDITLGIVTILLVMEATRRTIGLVMAIICLIFVCYAYLGPYMPSLLAHKGYNTYRIVGQLYLTTEGIFGLPLGVAATFVFIFVLFGSFLEGTGGGNFFTELAYSLTGRMVGGPAKTAVIASGFMGSVSGSAVANVVTTGSFTIPMMKNTGYKPHVAGAIEAAASTGGQLMPPIMGAGAFLMAEFTNIPYLHIVKISLIPAIMYYFAVYCFVHLEAKKTGIKRLDARDLPQLPDVIKRGFQFLIPIGVLIYFLIANYSPMMVGFVGVISVFLVGMIRKETRIGFWQILRLLEKGAKNAAMVSVACAAAGIIVGIVGLTGLGLKFSSVVLSLSGGIKLIAILLVGLASMFLGMGLPVTASYIVLVILAGPALMELGMAMITAHMIVFWYSQDANVTPPVALAAFAAAGIAGSEAMRTAFVSWKIAIGLYVIPILMAYSPLLLDGPPSQVLRTVASGTVGLLAFASLFEGYFHRKNTIFEQIMVGAAALGLFWPILWANIVGLLILLTVFFLQRRKS
ncbi:MAG: permease [Deltaproteobacteria bacterium CG_4_8_14_3_um_filter_45_9]|nr:MAG: permease [Deltaproteobacteria bacterium CG03_land_8_20_14_0_80_45_14]PIX23409.1 MAG: permease [Deltaproteobacteria bacterium CG_4_8_14_3_um_filter_45_9]